MIIFSTRTTNTALIEVSSKKLTRIVRERLKMQCLNLIQRKVDPYLNLAEEYGYSVFIIECQNDFDSIHDVPEEKVEAMRERWEEITT
jgi:hypothetical protein